MMTKNEVRFTHWKGVFLDVGLSQEGEVRSSGLSSGVSAPWGAAPKAEGKLRGTRAVSFWTHPALIKPVNRSMGFHVVAGEDALISNVELARADYGVGPTWPALVCYAKSACLMVGGGGSVGEPHYVVFPEQIK